MKIAVVSPCKTTGTTLATALIAATYGITQEKDTIVTFTSSRSRRICDYTGSEIKSDITASATQMYSLIMADSVKREECKDYMTLVGPHMYLLDTSASQLTLDERIHLMESIYSFDSVPLTLCDITTRLDIAKDDLAKEIVNLSDELWVVVNTDLKSVEGFKNWMSSGFLQTDKNFRLLVNNYDERAYSVYKIASIFGIKSNKILTIHRNPYVQKFTNDGKMTELIQGIIDKEPPVYELNADLERICKSISTSAGSRFKWGD